eukprot:6684296-Prymnesium_polylepis.1
MAVMQRAIVYGDAAALPEPMLTVGAPALLHLCRLASGIGHGTVAARVVGSLPKGSAAATLAASYAASALQTLLRVGANCDALLGALRDQPDGPTCGACSGVLAMALANAPGDEEGAVLLTISTLQQARAPACARGGAVRGGCARRGGGRGSPQPRQSVGPCCAPALARAHSPPPTPFAPVSYTHLTLPTICSV